MKPKANKPDEQNAANALCLQFRRHWRGVCDPGRSPQNFQSMKNLIRLATAIALFFPALASATTQEADLIIVEGGRYYTYNLPSLKIALPDSTIPEFVMLHTANYKGYRATWGVFDGQLYLVGIEGKLKDDKSHRLHTSRELFPNLTFPYPITSYTGMIELEGRSDDYVIEREKTLRETTSVTLKFEKGKLVDTKKATKTRKL